MQHSPDNSVHDDLKRPHGPSTTEIESVPTKVEDDLRNDEAVKILDTYDGDQTWTAEEENKLRRKIDYKLLPILVITYMLQYYDKAMLGQAAIFGLRTDLHLLVGNRYVMTAAIFYLGFIVGAYPAIAIAQRYPIDRVASIIVVIWGACLMSTAGCTNFQGIYAQRFFLGLLESGISPMFMLIVGSWYKKDEQALRMGAWYSATGFASVFSPLINYGLGHIHGALSPWRYMYLVAGAVTIIWGILIWFLLPPDPIRTRKFTEREKYIAVARLRSNNTGVRNTHLKTNQVWELLLDVKFWLMFGTAFLAMIANGPISTFLPIIIESFGFSGLDSLLLIMPIGFYAGCLQLLLPYLAYKFRNIRSYLVILAQLGTVISCLLLWLLPLTAKGGLLFACIILPSTGAGYAVLMGMQVANTAGYTKRTVASSGIFIGYCFGNFVGPLIFKRQDAPRYVPAFIVVTIAAIVAAVLVLIYRIICMWDNRRRDASGTAEGFEHAYEDDFTDKTNLQFRYIL